MKKRAAFHEDSPNGKSCSCGAKFKSKKELRQHMRDVNSGPAVVWINTVFPKQPPRRGRSR